MIAFPAGITGALDSMLEQAKDLTLTAGSACDLMGTLGATVGGDAIQLAKDAEAAVQAQIPKLMSVAGDMKNLVSGDLLAGLPDLENLPAIQELMSLGESINLESLLGNINAGALQKQTDVLQQQTDRIQENLNRVLDGLPPLPTIPDFDMAGLTSQITGAFGAFEGVASSAVSSITASVGGIESSLDSLKPLLVQSVNITSACGCAGVTDTVAGLPEDITALVPELESILSKAAGEGIPNLEAAASTALNQVKDAATSAGETLMAPGGVKDQMLEVASSMITTLDSLKNQFGI
jgi:hypothetical protein